MLKSFTKRGLSALLVLIMVLSMVPFSALATEEDTQAGGILEQSSDDTAIVTEPAEEITEAEATVTTEEYPNEEDDGHTHNAVNSERIPPLCEDTGVSAGTYCSLCGKTISGRITLEALGHNITQYEKRLPTFNNPGWEAHESCSRCGYTTKVEIPKLETPAIEDYETFIYTLALLEEVANLYVAENPGKDPLDLIIKYIRTGVDRYNSGSWGIMAGYEDAAFAQYVIALEDELNLTASSTEEMISIGSLKNLKNITLPNGEVTDIGHMFGTMDITYHNNFGVNHADVGGWAGDLVDLLEFSDYSGISGTLDEMIAQINEKTFLVTAPEGVGGFNQLDMIGDLDALYVMETIKKNGYSFELETSGLYLTLMMYFTPELSMADRAAFFLKNRLDGVSVRGDVWDAVYNAYSTNKVITTLEGTRDFNSDDLATLRKAVCYAYADYICKLAGDYVESTENSLYTVFSSETAVLAPGITQQIKMATTADGKQIVYYLATGDLTRDDVNLYANYNENDPTQGWEMQRVLDQANAAEDRHSDPESEHYVENYSVIAAVNGAGFNMSTGEPSGVLVMEGVEYQSISSAGFVGILKDGTPVIGTKEEYETIYKGQVQEAIACFGSRLIKDGKIVDGLDDTRASRTAIGFTKTGKVVLLVLDGRQEPFSAGGGYATLAQILLEAGCVEATNLDGGGSTTFVARQPGDEELSVINRPSDGFARSVSTSWMLVSTAPSSTAFDHAAIEGAYDHLTQGTSVQLTATGISPTGNTVAIPEGAYWAVSDERWGSITQDGLFTGLRNGSVNVYLMLEDTVIGSRTMNIVIPDNVIFTKANVDTVYGATAKLPVKVYYVGKEIAFSAKDLSLSVANPKAGSIVDISFVASSNESLGITNTQVFAALAVNPDVSVAIKISLYKQGELTFDFEQATGGDRQLAWQREVSNATTEDGIIFTVADPSQDMVTSYILAIDMTQIPMPARLEELTYMLPGSDIEGANAWTFLCQLAQRISDLTEIKATVHYNPDFKLDLSEMKLINDYFVLSGAEVDDENGTMTLTLRWKRQSQAINADTANPLCIVNGLKLIPKEDADWGSKNQIKAVINGSVSYTIYMRASALYSFSQKPENQATFGLYAYEHPEIAEDKGGYFSDTYKSFTDTYTLVNQTKNGWFVEDGGFGYYVEGVKLTGVKKVDGLYYNFGENGVIATQTPYSGLFVENGNTYYAKLGEPVTGWHNIGEDWYLFDWNTAVGQTGTYNATIDGVAITYEFENGKLVKGFWYEDENGLQYFYGPYYYKQGWKTIDGEQYFFSEYYAATGVYPVRAAHATYATWYEFTKAGALVGDARDGIYEYDHNLYYVVNQLTQFSGLYEINGDYYYASSTGTLKRNCTEWLSITRGIIPVGTYRMDENGKVIMTTELVDENGTLYYYLNGKRTANVGMVEHQGDIYLIGEGAMVTKNVTRWVSKTNGLKPVGVYTFDAEGKLVVYNGIVDGYYYVDGTKTSAGMVQIDGNYYFAASGGKLKVSEVSWCSNNNGLLPAGTYRFDAEGKVIMTTELVNENGTLYYYQDGKRTANAGLAMYNGDIYLVGAGAMVTKNVTRYVSRTNGLKPVGEYTFDAEGKLVIYNGIVNGYYYVDGVKTAAGLLNIDGNYYFAENGGKLKVNVISWISRNNNLLPAGTYRFDAEGKIIMTTELVNENGTLYYYQDGKRTANAGLAMYNGDIYLVGAGAMVTKNVTRYVSRTNGLKPVGVYTFDAEGKLVIYNGIVDGYYYVDGIKTAAGMLHIDGNYYFATSGGKLKASESSWCSNNNGLLPAGTYRFDAEGKVIMEAAVVNENGTLYYYQDGRRINKAGLVAYNGAIYFIGDGAIAVTNTTVTITKTNGLKEPGTYTFDAEGKLVTYNGIVDGYYYVEGIKTAAGMLYIDGNYYFAANGGKLKVSESSWCSNNNGLLPAGTYRFDAEGKIIMAAAVVNENGTLYYYQDGRRINKAGLVAYNGAIYFIGDGAIAVTNTTVTITKTNGLKPAGTYTFDADGKLVE